MFLPHNYNIFIFKAQEFFLFLYMIIDEIF